MSEKQSNPTLLSSATADGYQPVHSMHDEATDKAQVTWQRALESTLQGKDQKIRARALQIDLLEGLNAGNKLYLLSINDKLADTETHGKDFRNCSMTLDISHGICAAIVPILIPFSQTYKEVDFSLWSQKWNVGEAIAVASIMASLISTIIYTYQKASKTKEQAVLYADESQFTDMELSLFLSHSPPDYACTAAAPGELSQNIAFSNFVKNYMKIRKDHNRSKLFEGDLPATVGSKRNSTGVQGNHGGGVPGAGRAASRASQLLDTGHGTDTERLLMIEHA